ncbi:DUF2975 domain-containing protein [Sphingomonas sp. LB-2]|uniref:DUF2975 domain-containing protein n=1 Tax=Sphingomonas caeni TaxID=2984949 RepID=UPI00222EF502|nr:DUF2975 domain-containing protein [Sphingomonas caeni]MCW3848723.1 DUF2975 domain-containing protein [Sphingomonas caeni]
MPAAQPAALALSRAFLWILIGFNLFAGVLIVLALPGSFVFEPVFHDFFAKQPSVRGGMLIPVLRLWMLFAAVTVAAVHVMLMRVLAIIETVRAGDPFVPENAVRLKTIAWCLLGLQLLHLVSGVMARLMNAAGSHIDWQWAGLSGWLAVVLVFVLARVFEEGTRIRADLGAMI